MRVDSYSGACLIDQAFSDACPTCGVVDILIDVENSPKILARCPICLSVLKSHTYDEATDLYLAHLLAKEKE